MYRFWVEWDVFTYSSLTYQMHVYRNKFYEWVRCFYLFLLHLDMIYNNKLFVGLGDVFTNSFIQKCVFTRNKFLGRWVFSLLIPHLLREQCFGWVECFYSFHLAYKYVFRYKVLVLLISSLLRDLRTKLLEIQ